MIEIFPMSDDEIRSLLTKIEYGHLGCCRHGRPYVLPIHYVYVEPDIYIYTTRGMKTEFITANPEVCLQVEEVQNPSHWRSVIFTGRAQLLSDPEERKHAMNFIYMENPTLAPALARTWLGTLTRSTTEAIYRIHPQAVSGRKTL